MAQPIKISEIKNNLSAITAALRNANDDNKGLAISVDQWQQIANLAEAIQVEAKQRVSIFSAEKGGKK